MERLPVLDKGFIELEEWMGGDAAVARAARICYQSEARSPGADERLIRRELKREPKVNTIFEHAVLRWHVRCPIFVARQWIRHRIGSFNELSLRFCVAERAYYVPADEAGVEEYRAHMEASFDLYERLVAAGWKKERARAVLGTGVYTEFIWTVNAWSFMNWLTKRLDRAAQWEHRQYAQAAYRIWRGIMPVTASAFHEAVLQPLGLEVEG
ncbi:MAG: FAD-dependent thymidylate synthase [Anaerolineae bacterium]|nr:FAD-dependent thymidylate synthase [Anaerolineae bacterium]